MTTKTLMHVKTDDILATFVCVFDVYYFFVFLRKKNWWLSLAISL